MRILFQTLFLVIFIILLGFVTLYSIYYLFLFLLAVFTNKIFWIFMIVFLLSFIGINIFGEKSNI